MGQSDFDKAEYVQRVESLRPSPRLTRDLVLTKADQKRVDDAVVAVQAKGFAILPDFLDADRLASVQQQLEPIFAMTTERDADRKVVAGRASARRQQHRHRAAGHPDLGCSPATRAQ